MAAISCYTTGLAQLKIFTMHSENMKTEIRS